MRYVNDGGNHSIPGGGGSYGQNSISRLALARAQRRGWGGGGGGGGLIHLSQGMEGEGG